MTNVSPSTWFPSPGQAGHDAQHVARVGKAGCKDWNVVRYARDGDFVLVTNNASDFRRLYAAQPLHAGLVILIPTVSRVLHRKLFRAALDELAVVGEPVRRRCASLIEERARTAAPRLIHSYRGAAIIFSTASGNGHP